MLSFQRTIAEYITAIHDHMASKSDAKIIANAELAPRKALPSMNQLLC